MTIYADTAGQIYENEGENGLREFLGRIKTSTTVSEADIYGQNGRTLMADVADSSAYSELIRSTLESGNTELDSSVPETALAAKKFILTNGEAYVLVLRWDRPQSPPFFGESRLRYLRFAGLLLTAIVVCYALALYISSPIEKIRLATRRLAEGDLDARVGEKVGNRRDELAYLAKDFDVMAERIGQLITSQQRLTRDVSHELRSPLARMNVALEIAKKKTNAETVPMIERLEREAQRLNEMVSSLLTLAGLESGSQEFERTRIDLKELIEYVAEDADFEARANGRSVRITNADECTLIGSEGLLQRAIENVVRNAVKYTSAGTVVEISLKCTRSLASIQIIDHGGGVPENELANLFRPFYRVSESRDRTSGGIGLGLAIAEQAIKVHNGRISARNQGDGLLVELDLKKS